MLSEQIKQARELRGWSQEELAERLGVNVSTIGHWESGRHEPSPYYRLMLAALGISLVERVPERKRRMEESSGTYFVPANKSQDESIRLHAQAQVTTAKLGGPLPEQSDPARFRHVLDVGCGTGDWLIELASVYPEMDLTGIDRNSHILDFARAQASRAGVEDRITFRVMDAMLGLELPDDSFDLVNLRFGMSWLRTWDWANLLREMRRVLKPGGTLRLVETQFMQANKGAFNRFWELGIAGARQSGHLTDDKSVVTVVSLFPGWLAAAGFSSIGHREIDTLYIPGAPEYELFATDMRLLVKLSESHISRWMHVTNYRMLAERVYRELDDPAFSLTWTLATVWATR